MRSASISWLANLNGLNTFVLRGGYKFYRRWVLKQFENEWPIRLLGGKTGTGKTDLLIELAKRGTSIIDLEGLANHRGSSFGALGLPLQPSNEHYENLIADSLFKAKKVEAKEIWLEAESAHLGQCRIPQGLFKQMQKAPILELTRSKDERITRLIKLYCQYGSENLESATRRISRRLGPQRTMQALDAIKLENWDQACLAILNYYDRCYDFELAKAKNVVSIDICGLNNYRAAEILIQKGLVK